ncbi:MAG: hypothetical protein VX127_15945 [Myxococcota bacterium]|nr:hypothetical protein [Myxococcota bacterium]
MGGAFLAIVVAGIPAADAHKPSYANGHSTPSEAFEVVDPEISIALYATMTCTEDALWMHMETGDLDEVWLELGVPVLDRLEAYRPSLAIVAEGYPDADVPFDLPPNMGAVVISTDDVETPIDFFEPFTQTDSWILFRDWFDVPPNSEVYLVAYNPDEYTGKLWVAVGLTEDFSDVDMSEFGEWVDKTQAFHEVGDTEEHVELDCSAVYDASEPVEATEAPQSTGCASVPASGNSTLWAILGALVGGLRRRRVRR